MEKFDLEKAKAGYPVCTRDGHEARIICFDREGGNPIVALVKDADNETIFSYDNMGRYDNDGREYMCDLFMKTIKQEAWINLYKDKDERLFPELILFKSEKEAKDRMESGEKSSRLYYKTVKIEWEE
jgi:hypothetical protein|nr:MAG TPA: hypothetical protein [Caudoviricetes sp.]